MKQQLELFETSELVQIKQYLMIWNETSRNKRVAQIKNPRADCLRKREDVKG